MLSVKPNEQGFVSNYIACEFETMVHYDLQDIQISIYGNKIFLHAFSSNNKNTWTLEGNTFLR